MTYIRPAGFRPLFTDGYFDGWRNEKLRPDKNGPVFHAGQIVACILPIPIKYRMRPVWRDDYGSLRIGHTDDMHQMLDDLNIPDRAF